MSGALPNLPLHDFYATELALARAIADLRHHDASAAAGPAAWIIASPITLSVWREAHAPERRERIAARVDACRRLLGRTQ